MLKQVAEVLEAKGEKSLMVTFEFVQAGLRVPQSPHCPISVVQAGLRENLSHRSKPPFKSSKVNGGFWVETWVKF